MKLRQLAAGVATGYVTKAVQLVATMALVPFLLRPDILGVADYGRAFTLIAYMAVGTVVTAGIRLSFLRSISQAIGEDPQGVRRHVGRLIGTGTTFLLMICGTIAVGATLFENALLDFVRFPHTDDYRTALHLALVWMTVENALFLFRGPLIARGAITYVNVIAMVEVLLRVGFLVWLLPESEAPIVVFVAVHGFFAALRSTAYFGWNIVRAPSDLRGMRDIRFTEVWSTVLYSRSITMSEAASFLVLRAPVVFAAGHLGAKEAGFIAIVINTIQNYVQQILFTVVQPLAVPIAARFDPRRISASARSLFYDLEALYCATVILAISGITVFAPDWIRLWLGSGYESIVLPSQLILAGAGLEIAYSVRKSLLIGQGVLPEAIWRITPMAIATAGIIWLCIAVWDRWTLAVYATALYLIASNIFGIGTVWSKHFLTSSGEATRGLPFVAFAPALVAAVLVSRVVATASWQMDALLGAVVLGWSGAWIAFLVIPPRKIMRTLQRLRGAMDRDLFGA